MLFELTAPQFGAAITGLQQLIINASQALVSLQQQAQVASPPDSSSEGPYNPPASE